LKPLDQKGLRQPPRLHIEITARELDSLGDQLSPAHVWNQLLQKPLVLPRKNNLKKKKEGVSMPMQKREESGDFSNLVGSRKKPMKIAVVARQQTFEEERKCTAAIQLLLTELVRQQLGCKEKEND
jgi:hypothetical protein